MRTLLPCELFCTFSQVLTLRFSYDPLKYYEGNAELKRVIDMIRSGHFSPDQPDRFHPLMDTLLVHGDRFCLLADYDVRFCADLLSILRSVAHYSCAQAYVKCQDQISKDFEDEDAWMKKCILNVASGGFFSSDRTITDYSENIWGAEPCPVE